MEHLGTMVEQKQFLYIDNNPANTLINIFNLQYGKQIIQNTKEHRVVLVKLLAPCPKYVVSFAKGYLSAYVEQKFATLKSEVYEDSSAVFVILYQ